MPADKQCVCCRCIRLQHLETFEFRSLLTHELVGAEPRGAIIETVLARLDGIPVAPGSARRCGPSYVHTSLRLTRGRSSAARMKVRSKVCVFQSTTCFSGAHSGFQRVYCLCTIIWALSCSHRLAHRQAEGDRQQLTMISSRVPDCSQPVQGWATVHLGHRQLVGAAQAANHPVRPIQPDRQRADVGAEPYSRDGQPAPDLLWCVDSVAAPYSHR